MDYLHHNYSERNVDFCLSTSKWKIVFAHSQHNSIVWRFCATENLVQNDVAIEERRVQMMWTCSCVCVRFSHFELSILVFWLLRTHKKKIAMAMFAHAHTKARWNRMIFENKNLFLCRTSMNDSFGGIRLTRKRNRFEQRKNFIVCSVCRNIQRRASIKRQKTTSNNCTANFTIVGIWWINLRIVCFRLNCSLRQC